MDGLRRIITLLNLSNPERSAQRAHLKAAKGNDPENYLALAANYSQLVNLYFGVSSDEPDPSRDERSRQLFAQLWQQLDYAERLSDFEYMLTCALLHSSPQLPLPHSSDPLRLSAQQLPPVARFALLAYELENWKFERLAMILRIRPAALHRLLSQARCALCGIEWSTLAKEEQACLENISRALDARPNLRANRALSEQVSQFPRVSEIRAEWLSLRPELVEVRCRYEFSPCAREALLKNIYDAIELLPMERAPLMDRVLNTVHFSRHRQIKVG